MCQKETKSSVANTGLKQPLPRRYAALTMDICAPNCLPCSHLGSHCNVDQQCCCHGYWAQKRAWKMLLYGLRQRSMEISLPFSHLPPPPPTVFIFKFQQNDCTQRALCGMSAWGLCELKFVVLTNSRCSSLVRSPL